jgi:hypothetical protein
MDSEVDRQRAAAAILPRAGTPIPEVRWLVAAQDSENVWGPMLWTLAGVCQLTPQAMEVWEAWSPANPRFVLQAHRVHPGWMAVADGSRAVVAALPGIEKVAPKEIFVDARARALRICFQSPRCRPLDLAEAPEALAAGPAYIYLEPAGPDARKAEAYRDPKERPAPAAAGEASRALAPTECNFNRMALVEAAARPEAPAAIADAELSSHEPGKPDEIPIWIDETRGRDFEAFPITRGVPLARGVLRDAGQVELRDEAGAAVPCVARPLAFWPDRSIKWLLLDLAAKLRAGAGAKLKLVVGARARPAAGAGPSSSQRPLEVSEEPGRVTVDTGPLRMSFRVEDGKLALEAGLDLNGDGKASRDEQIISSGLSSGISNDMPPGDGSSADLLGCRFSHIDDSARYTSSTWIDPGRSDPGLPRITELRIEERSPLRAVVLLRADLRHDRLASTIPAEHRPKVGTPVSLRLHFHAGSPLVRLQHTFLFAGDVRFDFLRELGVCLPLPAGAVKAIHTSLDGVPVDLSGAAEAGILQEGADSALAWKASGAKAARGKAVVPARGRIAGGWLDVSGDRWGVTVGLSHMREMFPQEIHVDQGGARALFYSPRVPPMDVRRYAFKYGDGESTSTGFGSAFGALRTHEAFWCFHPAGPAASAATALVEEMLDPPLARVRPRHVADTLALGRVAEHGAPTSDRHFDAVLLHMPRMHQHNREFWRWFGFWSWGDEIQVYDSGRDRWAIGEGRYGWYNNEPLRDCNYHLAYLLTGNRRIWEQAEAMSWHVFEVDVRHASPQPFMSAGASLEKQDYDHSTTHGIDLCGRRHNCQHWADGYFGERVGSPAGFRLCYYQTGDPVWREYLGRQVAAACATRRSEYRSADGEEAILWALIAGYEMALDEGCLERLKSYARLQVEFAKAHGALPSAKSNWDWATNAPGAPPEAAGEELWIWSFGGHVALVEIAELLGDPELDRMLREWTLALEGLGSGGKRREEWSTNMAASPLLAHYYRRTGDPRAPEWFRKRASAFHSTIPKEAPAEDLTMAVMGETLPDYTPNDGYGWVYCTSSFWYIGIPSWQGALRERAGTASPARD